MKNLLKKIPKITGVVKLTLIILMLFYLTSCQKLDLATNPINVESPLQIVNGTPIQTTEIIKLGKKLETPFKLENMQKAYNNLMSNSKYKTYGTNYPTITKTHRYIKFKPKNEDEANILYNWDTTNLLTSTPKDVEILSSGAAYRDPECKPGQPSYMYGNIPIDARLPKIVEYEILYYLYVPKMFINGNSTENPNKPEMRNRLEYLSNTENNTNILFDKLIIEEAFYITNNVKNTHNSEEFKDKLINDTKNKKEATNNKETTTSTRPPLTITGRLIDYNSIPFEGMRIGAYYRYDFIPLPPANIGGWVPNYNKREATYTNNQGVFSFIVYRDFVYQDYLTYINIDIVIDFGAYNTFRITNDNGDVVRFIGDNSMRLNASVINNPNSTLYDAGNLVMVGSEYLYYLYTCNQAARHYYFEDIKGLRRPPTQAYYENGNTGLTIQCFSYDHQSNLGDFQPEREKMNGGAAIHIYFHYNNIRPRYYFYSTVIHELAHASHWTHSLGYYYYESIVKESWARGVQWELTKMVYPNFNSNYWRGAYTGICEDLIDPVRQQKTCVDANSTNKIYYDDNVAGYTIKQLEDALLDNSYTVSGTPINYRWNTWKSKIISRIENPTKIHVSNAFKIWNWTSNLPYTPDPVNVPVQPPPSTNPTYPIQPPIDGEFCYPERGTNRRICL